jgi:maltose O-acetyltransferase
MRNSATVGGTAGLRKMPAAATRAEHQASPIADSVCHTAFSMGVLAMSTRFVLSRAHSADEGDDPEGIESRTVRARLLTRLRGGQTLNQMRKHGLRAEAPVRLVAGSLVDARFPWAVEIGAHTIIANDVRIIAHDAAIKRLTGYTEVRPVVIGKRCYIGAGTIILPGAVIGDEAVIGAGAVVRGEIPPRSMAVGTPAKVVGSIEDLRRRHLDQIESSPRFGRPAELGVAEISEMRRALKEHGRIYVR